MKQQVAKDPARAGHGKPKVWTARDHGELAQFFAVAPNTISQWRRAGAPISGRGPHDIRPVLRWRIARDEARLEREERRAAAEALKSDPEQAWKIARAELTQMRFEQERDRLMPVEEHDRFVTRLRRTFVRALCARAPQIARISGEPDDRTRLLAIEDAFCDLLEDLAEGIDSSPTCPAPREIHTKDEATSRGAI